MQYKFANITVEGPFKPVQSCFANPISSNWPPDSESPRDWWPKPQGLIEDAVQIRHLCRAQSLPDEIVRVYGRRWAGPLETQFDRKSKKWLLSGGLNRKGEDEWGVSTVGACILLIVLILLKISCMMLYESCHVHSNTAWETSSPYTPPYRGIPCVLWESIALIWLMSGLQ